MYSCGLHYFLVLDVTASCSDSEIGVQYHAHSQHHKRRFATENGVLILGYHIYTCRIIFVNFIFFPRVQTDILGLVPESTECNSKPKISIRINAEYYAVTR